MILKKTSRLLLILLVVLSALTAAIPAAADTTKHTYSVTLKKDVETKKKTVMTGDVIGLQLKYSGKVLNNEKVDFRSTKPAVASVSASGVITARKKGTVVITATYKRRGVRFKLKVKEPVVAASEAQLLPDDLILFISDEDVEDYDSADPVSYSPLRQKVISFAESFVGVLPYVWAGNSLKSGTDCSGFVHLVCAKFGINVPRSASEFQRMSNIEYDDLLPGDIIVYKNGGHVGFYAGNDMVVHCKGRDYGTVKEKMWYGTPTGYVRLVND